VTSNVMHSCQAVIFNTSFKFYKIFLTSKVMDQLKIAQTEPTFTVYPDEMQKKYTQFDHLLTSFEHISSSNYLLEQPINDSITLLTILENNLTDDDLIISSSSKNAKTNNKQPLSKDDANYDSKI
ncbi:14402_t:CDS:1, partial [Cetraspora pellucida]